VSGVCNIHLVAELLEELQPVVEKHRLRVFLDVGVPQNPRLVMVHREHRSVVVLFRTGELLSRHTSGIQVTHYDLHDIDHHYLQNYNTGSPQSATSAVRATAARVSLIYDRFLTPPQKRPYETKLIPQ
jgi:hypothetical protein